MKQRIDSLKLEAKSNFERISQRYYTPNTRFILSKVMIKIEREEKEDQATEQDTFEKNAKFKNFVFSENEIRTKKIPKFSIILFKIFIIILIIQT